MNDRQLVCYVMIDSSMKILKSVFSQQGKICADIRWKLNFDSNKTLPEIKNKLF